VVFTLITGVVYPAAVTGIAQGLMPFQANGSMLAEGGGSALIGQPFDGPEYFWSRPSATGSVPYNAAASSGSNLGPTNSALGDAVVTRVEALRDANVAVDIYNPNPVPVDLVTASASGLDPHISPAAAAYQAARVARVRNLSMTEINELIAESTDDRQFGILGEPRVNVLLLNRSLDAQE
jgi:K+-transporting ATPase ATPase C chain